ncbi:MAG: hypothetical protein ACF8TS_22650, partial [Maioricimonas sp. JB049]
RVERMPLLDLRLQVRFRHRFSSRAHIVDSSTFVSTGNIGCVHFLSKMSSSACCRRTSASSRLSPGRPRIEADQTETGPFKDLDHHAP